MAIKWRVWCVNTRSWSKRVDGLYASQREALEAIHSLAEPTYSYEVRQVEDSDSAQAAPAPNPKALDSAHKVPTWLTPGAIILGIAQVLDFGRKKPGRWPYNWRDRPVNLTDYISAMERHLQALKDGEWIDPEHGFSHVKAIAASCAIVEDANEVGTLTNDLPKVPGKSAQILRSVADRAVAGHPKG